MDTLREAVVQPQTRDERLPSETCPGCGAAIHRRFCSHCGERSPADRRYSFHDLLHEALENFAHFDGTLIRTVRTLFRSPGALTSAYMRGDRIRYTRPLQLFLVANVAFFLISGPLKARSLDTPLSVHLRAMPYRALATSMVNDRTAQRRTTLAAYAPVFDAAATTQAKSLVILMVPIFALLVALVNHDRHRYAVEHGVFALHFYVFFFAVFMMAAGLAVVLVRLSGQGIDGHDPLLTLLVTIILTAYLAIAERRVYGVGWVGGLIRGFLLAIGAFLVLSAYRAVLFFTAFMTT